jgi:hypothetical protein
MREAEGLQKSHIPDLQLQDSSQARLYLHVSYSRTAGIGCREIDEYARSPLQSLLHGFLLCPEPEIHKCSIHG